MLLKRIDETLTQGLYDLDGGPAEVEVYLVEPSIGEGIVNWEVVREGVVPPDFLHYNDAADGSNKLNGSWQGLYVSEAALEEAVIYSGSSIYFSDGSPNFGGVAKSAIYLRYSRGFIDWLAGFDSAAAEKLRSEIPAFEALMENRATKKLPTAWHKFKAPPQKWPLIVVCRLSDGRFLVHWLNKDTEGTLPLEALGIDVVHSRELMGFLTAPATSELELIAEEFQTGSGLGRNAFGKEYKLDAIRRSEYLRLMGVAPENTRADVLDLWSKKLQYRRKVAPSPDTSTLIFLPEGELTYSELKELIDKENEKKNLYFDAKKNGGKSEEEREELKALRPEIIPTPYSATVFLTNLEGSTKKKRIIQQIFPDVSLEYLQVLNAELLQSNLENTVVDYMKSALTGQTGDTPSVYRYWTEVFTKALQRQPISAREVFANFQRFAKSQSGEALIDKLGARRYFRVIGKLLRLQHLIVTAREEPAKLLTNEFQQELVRIEQFNLISRGVFGPMSTTVPSGAELIGEAYGLLRDKQKSKLDNFIRQAWAGVPDSEFPIFVRGALTGMLLNELCWSVQQEGRRFSATQGRHPSRLRGRELQNVFNKGIGLLMNLDKEQLFNCRLLPFLKSLEPESRRDSFNSGLISGMTYFEKKSDDNNEVKHD